MNNFWPQFFPSSWEAEFDVYGVPFTNDISIGFVRFESSGYSYVLKNEFKSRSFEENGLLKSSLDSLGEDLSKVQVKLARPNGATVVWLEVEDNFAAIRLLLPKVQAFIRKHVGEEILFTIPSRDLILIWNADAPNSLTNKHRNEAIEDFENDEYALSPKVYKFSDSWPCESLC